MKRIAAVALTLLALSVVLIGCSSSKKSSGSSGSSGTATAPVIKNFSFSPNPIKVKHGTQVTWTNRDGSTHTVQADGNSFSSPHLPTGQSFSFTFTKAGTYTYHCAIHTYMKGTVIVS